MSTSLFWTRAIAHNHILNVVTIFIMRFREVYFESNNDSQIKVWKPYTVSDHLAISFAKQFGVGILPLTF